MALVEAIFLDKDGTLLDNDVACTADPGRIQFIPEVNSGLRRLGRLGLPLIMTSNEPGVALGHFPEQALGPVERQLAFLFEQADASMAGFYYCKHHPLGTLRELARPCQCRMPAAGILRRAAVRHNFSLSRSWLLGNTLDAIEAGRRAGCETILINNGHETQWQTGPLRTPHHVVDDFDQASRLIFERDALNAVPLEPANDPFADPPLVSSPTSLYDSTMRATSTQ